MSDSAALLADAARRLLGPGISVAGRGIDDGQNRLLPDEALAMTRAVPARRAEFAAGRMAARAALARLGAPDHAIPMGRDRAPVWPPGYTGSITHAGNVALAAVAHMEESRALGLDLEPAGPLAPDLWPSILRPEEAAWLRQQPEQARGITARMVFGAKEATFKAQFALSGQLIDFRDVLMEITPIYSTFRAIFMENVPPFSKGSALHGRVAETNGHILACLRIAPG